MSPAGQPSPVDLSWARVLLVGGAGVRLENDCVGVGLTCSIAHTAAAAVTTLRAVHCDVVVAPPTLPDMAGTAFALGILKHFPDPLVLLFSSDVENPELAAFTAQGRFLRVPPQTSPLDVAQHLHRRLSERAPPPLVPSVQIAEAPPAPTTPPADDPRLAELEHAVAELRSLVVTRELERDDAIGQRDELRVDCESRTAARDDALNDAEGVRAQLQDFVVERDDLRARVTELEAELSAAAAQGAGASELTQALAAANNQQAALAQALANKMESTAALDETNRRLSDELTDARAESARLASALSELEAERAQLAAQVAARTAALEEELAALVDAKRSLESDNETLREELVRAQAEPPFVDDASVVSAEAPEDAPQASSEHVAALEESLEQVTQERDRVLAALTEASRKLMMFEDAEHDASSTKR